MNVLIQRLGQTELPTFQLLLDLFGRAFAEEAEYGDHRPSAAYLTDLLASDGFIAMVAVAEGNVVGGLAAYVLKKFEQERSEIYVYDLAVDQDFRRQGIATALLKQLQLEASKVGAHVIFIRADQGDEPAIALYESLGTREEVLHFDIPPK